MNCAEVRALFSAYLDKSLPPGLRSSVEEHVDDCAKCTADLNSLQQILTDLHTMDPLVPPADIGRRVKAQLAQHRASRTRGASPSNVFSVLTSWQDSARAALSYAGLGLASAALVFVLLYVPQIIRQYRTARTAEMPPVALHRQPLIAEAPRDETARRVPPARPVTKPQPPSLPSKGGAVRESSAPPKPSLETKRTKATPTPPVLAKKQSSKPVAVVKENPSTPAKVSVTGKTTTVQKPLPKVAKAAAYTRQKPPSPAKAGATSKTVSPRKPSPKTGHPKAASKSIASVKGQASKPTIAKKKPSPLPAKSRKPKIPKPAKPSPKRGPSKVKPPSTGTTKHRPTKRTALAKMNYLPPTLSTYHAKKPMIARAPEAGTLSSGRREKTREKTGVQSRKLTPVPVGRSQQQMQRLTATGTLQADREAARSTARDRAYEAKGASMQAAPMAAGGPGGGREFGAAGMAGPAGSAGPPGPNSAGSAAGGRRMRMAAGAGASQRSEAAAVRKMEAREASQPAKYSLRTTMRAVQKPEARLRKLTPLHFRLLKVSFPKKVLAGRPFNIAVILKAGGNIRRGVVEILLPPSLSIGADSAEQVGGTHRVYSGPIGEGLLTQLVVTHLKALTPGDHILTVCIRSEEPGRSEVRRVARVKVKKP